METIPKQEQSAPKKQPKLPKVRKKRRWVKPLVILALLAAAGGGYWYLHSTANSGEPVVSGYTAVPVERRDVTVSVSGSDTLQPADSYNVTTLMSSEILSAPFEEEQTVSKDALLYTLDSGDARDNLSRANLAVQQAQLQYQQAKDAMTPKATLSGILSEVYVHNGDSVAAGGRLCKIVASRDLTIDFLFPYASSSAFYAGQAATVFIGSFEGSVQGTVVSVSDSSVVTSNGMEACTVRVKLNNPGVVSNAYTASAVIGNYTSYGNSPIIMPASAVVYADGSGTVSGFDKLIGSTVKQGDVLCTVDSEGLSDTIETAKLNLESAQLSAKTAQENLDNYTIKSPISGTVIEKKLKAGDKVDGVSSGTMATIYDLSSLKLQMNVDELNIGKVKVGQTVQITCDALPGQTFTGTVDKVSINGSTSNGFTTYPVTIVLQDYGDLWPGMNVSALILGETASDTLAVPVDAVSRGNTVQVALPGALAEDGVTVIDPTQVEERSVVLGVNDDKYVAVTSGLEEGEMVLMETPTGDSSMTMGG